MKWLDPEWVGEWVAQGLRCAVAPPDGRTPAVTFALGGLAHVPPIGVCFDVAQALFDGPALRRRPPSHSGLRAAVAAYDEYFIGRLVHGSRFRAAQDAVRGHPDQGRSLSLFLELVVGRLYVEDGPAHGLVRAALQDPPHRHDDATVRDALVDGYASLAARARRASTLIIEADVIALQNLDALESAAQRLALSQLVEGARTLDRQIPRRLRRRSQRGPVPTQARTDSTYPVGGYSAIGTQGGIESLVGSELMYMERDADIDPFVVRWASNELLRYLRDEGVHLRPHRRIQVELDPNLTDARVLDPGAERQRIVTAMGALVVWVRRVVDVLSATDLSIVVDVPETLAEEAALLKLALRPWVVGGTVAFESSDAVPDTIVRWSTAPAQDTLQVAAGARWSTGETSDWATATRHAIERVL